MSQAHPKVPTVPSSTPCTGKTELWVGRSKEQVVGDELQVWGVLGMGRRVVRCGHRVPSEHRWVSGCVGLGSGVYRGVQGTGCMRGVGTGLQGVMAGWRAGQVGCRVLGAGFGVRVHNAR